MASAVIYVLVGIASQTATIRTASFIIFVIIAVVVV